MRAVVIAQCCDVAIASLGKGMSQQYRLVRIDNGESIQQYSSDNTGNSSSISIGARKTASDNSGIAAITIK